MAQLFEVLDTATGKKKLRASTVTLEQETPTGTVNGSNTNFVISLTPVSINSVFVYVDGLILKNNLYSVNLGTRTITFNTAPSPGQDVYVVYAR